MVKGLYTKCKNCHKKFWTEVKLGFGIRKNKATKKLLDCLLDKVKFYFKCPYCKNYTSFSIEFFSNKSAEVTQIVENPNYIG